MKKKQEEMVDLLTFIQQILSEYTDAGYDEINCLAMGSALTGNLQEIKHETK